METLFQIWKRLADAGYESDKGSVHAYIPVYEKLLAPYRETAKTVLEIGLFKGNSLRMWEQYFTTAYVHGIDCSETPHGGLADLRPMIAEGYHNIHILDGTSEEAIQKEFGDTKWSVLIEDSSHSIESQLKAIEIFRHKMEPGGIMIIEDIADIDKHRWVFESIAGLSVEIIDLRHIKNRFDDCLVVLRF